MDTTSKIARQSSSHTLQALYAVLVITAHAPAHASVEQELRICYEKLDPKLARECFDELLKRRDEFIGPPDPDVEKIKAAQAAQSAPAAEHARRVYDVIKNNLDPSYVTFTSGVHLNGDRTTKQMLYEAQLTHNFRWLEYSANTRQLFKGLDLWLDVPVRIGVRQLTETSKPVRTPTYNPGVRLLLSGNQGTRSIDEATYFSIGAHHYSNGQEGENFDKEGIANLRNGTFNTNYLEIAAHRWLKTSMFPWTRLSYRQEFFGTWENIQDRQYPKSQLTAQARFKNVEMGAYTASFQVSESYRLGLDYIERPGINLAGNPTPGVKAKFGDKFQTAIELWLHGPYSKEFALYARYDHGYDYYNINFQKRINRMQFGIVAK
ncbi:MAG: hypothetical protein JNJ55_05700 [Betaproteobacteria bacterium]|nr:hypothetical protein [Betaproteobacteria bacterium]